MPANLNLLPRKEFELTLSDGTIVKGQFGTWALARFGKKKNLGLDQIFQLFYKPEVGEDGKVVNTAHPQITDMIDFILSAVEYKEREAGEALTFNDLKLSKWVDDYNHETGTPGVVMILFNHASSEDNGEKKSDLNPEDTAGKTSSESLTVPV